MQEIYDNLYAKSRNNEVLNDLYDIIISEQNILLAYRNIKKNEGSSTAGVNKRTIKNWKTAKQEDYIRYVRQRLQNYFPHKVKRVEIPKPNGKLRPLGIPTMEDRLIQQCIKQVLEPILEAKFYPLSFGFRPNRSTKHAIQEFMRMVNICKLYYVIDIDIKGFFDNVNHGKLLKQLWSMKIRDKRVIAILSKMLKAEIEKVGKPTKGTPQGGILSPLLSNVVLNELDWWIDRQWKGFQIKERKKCVRKTGRIDRGNVYSKLRVSTKLREMHIIRYADDFKVLCKSEEEAKLTFMAIKKWLNNRLKLDINEDKSQIVDIRKKSSEFLGIRFKAKPKSHKWVINSHMTDKSKSNAIEKIRKRIDKIRESPTAQNVMRYNSTVLGLQNYYNVATHISKDFSEIEYAVRKYRYNQLQGIITNSGEVNKSFKDIYKGYNYQKQFVERICMFPIAAVKHVNPMAFSEDICDYSSIGRDKIHSKLKINVNILHYLMENPPLNSTTELADNRLSLYSAQWGKCYITGVELQIGEMEVHHKIPKAMGGSDEYKNLVWITDNIHKLVHATNTNTISQYQQKVVLNKEQLCKLNELRVKAGNSVIE